MSTAFPCPLRHYNDISDKLYPQERLKELSKKIEIYSSFKNILFKYVKDSASPHCEDKVKIAAANAISILNYAEVSFNNLKFKNIQIPGADLSNCALNRVSFRNANLQNVNFKNAKLNDVIFTKAQMKGVCLDNIECFCVYTDGVKDISESERKLLSSNKKELSNDELYHLFHHFLDELADVYDDKIENSISTSSNNPPEFFEAIQEFFKGNHFLLKTKLENKKNSSSQIFLCQYNRLLNKSTLKDDHLVCCVIAQDKAYFIDSKNKRNSFEFFVDAQPIGNNIAEGDTYRFLAIVRKMIALNSNILFKKYCSQENLCEKVSRTIRMDFKKSFENKTNQFLATLNAEVKLDLKLDQNKFTVPAQFIERCAVQKPDFRIAVKGYACLYPKIQEVITFISNKILDCLENEGLFSENISLDTIDKFKASLQIALYQDSHLQQILKSALKQNWLIKPFPKLNLIGLSIPISAMIKEKWDKFLPLIDQFKSDNYEQYKFIISFMVSRLQEGLMQQNQYWYNKMIQNLNLSKLYFSKIKQTETPPAQTISPNIPKSPAPPQLKFPTHALKTLLDYSESIDLGEMLKSANAEDQQTKLFSTINYFLQLDMKNPAVRIASNITWSKFSSICKNSNFSISNFVNAGYAAYKGKDLKTADQSLHGGFAKIITAAKEFMEYLQGCKNPNGGIDHQTIAIALLQDKNLNDLLSNDKEIEKISTLIASLEIPDITKISIRKLIKIFADLQQQVLKLPENDTVLTYAELGMRLVQNNFKESMQLMSDILVLIKTLEKIIHFFLEPQISPLQQLALPIVKNIFTNKVPLAHHEPNADIEAPQPIVNFLDCKKIFANYNSKELGNFLSAPVTTYIQSRNLGFLTFSTTKCGIISNDIIYLEHQGLSFKEFCFKRSKFQDFAFKNIYFQDCDFSDVLFTGKITFSRTYMDSKTASTFFPALVKAMIMAEDLKVEGIKGIILCTLKDPLKNNPLTIPKELENHVEIQHANWITAGYTSIPQNPVQTTHSRGFMGSLLSGITHKGYNAANNIAGHIGGYASYYSSTQKEHAEEIQKNNIDEISASDDLKRALEKLNLELTAKQTTLQCQLEGLINNQGTLNSVLDAKIEEQRIQIENVNNYLEILKIEKREKERIRVEQKLLLDKNNHVTKYYQTFLTELSSSFQAIFILQNHLKLIDPVQGKVTNISNKQDKIGIALDSTKDKANAVEKASQILLTIKDQFVGVAKYAVPFLKLCPVLNEACDAIGAGIDVIQKLNDQNKLKESKTVFRGLLIKDIEKIADAIARKISFAYEEQILLLSEEGAIHFAESGVTRIIAALFNGYIDSRENFALQAWLAIHIIETTQSATFLDYFEIPFVQKKLPSKSDENSYYISDDLYRLCGIAYENSDNNWARYSNDEINNGEKPLPNSLTTNAKKFGYMHVSKEEEWEYFRHSVTLDPVVRAEIPKETKKEASKKNHQRPMGALNPFGTNSTSDSFVDYPEHVLKNFTGKITKNFQEYTYAFERHERKLLIDIGIGKNDDLKIVYRAFSKMIYDSFHKIISDYEIDEEAYVFILTMKSSQDAKDLIRFLSKDVKLNFAAKT